MEVIVENRTFCKTYKPSLYTYLQWDVAYVKGMPQNIIGDFNYVIGGGM